MPHDYDKHTHKFAGVGRARVRRELDRLTDRIRKDAFRIGKRYESGKITLAEFEVAMRELIKSGNIVAASVGRGGFERMTQADWGRVGSRLKSEYTYLGRFTRKLALGKLAKAVTPYRAKKYADGVIMSYHQAVRTEHEPRGGDKPKVRLIQNSKEGCDECTHDAGLGWIDVEDMTELGSRICGNFCLCDLEFQDDYERETGNKVS